jgi:hypothetical protein
MNPWLQTNVLTNGFAVGSVGRYLGGRIHRYIDIDKIPLLSAPDFFFLFGGIVSHSKSEYAVHWQSAELVPIDQLTRGMLNTALG